jgi:hypothetical protein
VAVLCAGQTQHVAGHEANTRGLLRIRHQAVTATAYNWLVTRREAEVGSSHEPETYRCVSKCSREPQISWIRAQKDGILHNACHPDSLVEIATCLSLLLRFLQKNSSDQKVLQDKHVIFLIEQSRPLIPDCRGATFEPSRERFDASWATSGEAFLTFLE